MRADGMEIFRLTVFLRDRNAACSECGGRREVEITPTWDEDRGDHPGGLRCL
jgi:hypothetical protein